MSTLAIINIIGISQGLFLCFYLLSHRKRHTWGNLFLVVVLTGFLFTLWDLLLIDTRYALQYPHIVLLGFPFRVVYGPLVWLITLSSLPNFRFRRRYLWHFSFFGLYVIYGLYTYHLHSYGYKLKYLQALYATLQTSSSTQFGFSVIVFNVALLAQFIFYIVKSYFILKKQHQYLTVAHKKWLKHILIAAMLLWFIGFSKFLTALSLHFIAIELIYISCILVGLYLYGLTLTSMQNPTLFGTLPVKYKSSSLKPRQSKALLDELTQYMQLHRPFADANLTLKKLANQTNIPERQLSQIINTELQQNFYEFLNHYRIEAAKQMLTDPSYGHLTILAIAYEVGFNSKSSFNAAFKKIADTTPSQYKNSQ